MKKRIFKFEKLTSHFAFRIRFGCRSFKINVYVDTISSSSYNGRFSILEELVSGDDDKDIDYNCIVFSSDVFGEKFPNELNFADSVFNSAYKFLKEHLYEGTI